MAKLRQVSDLWEEYKGWFFLIFIVYCLYSLRKVFGGIGDGLGAVVEGATAKARQDAQDKTDKVRVSAVNAAVKKAGGPSTDQLATWRADAATLADYFGTTGGNGITRFLPGLSDQGKAFSLLKQSYSRLLLYNNKPMHRNTATKKLETQSRETADSLKRAEYWTVLVPFYKDVTNGNDLKTDIRRYIKDVTLTPYLSWII